jgi:alginate O-acetyltransferase complex protein AlgI
MVFSSLSYVFFLPLVFGITYSLAPRFRPHFLLLASYAFYMAWKPQYVLVIIALTLFDFFAAQAIENRGSLPGRRAIWIASLCANLGALFVFKYAGFFAEEWNRLAHFLQAGGAVPVPDILLPIGISFHTFQAISYTTDVYLGHERAERSLPRFALFIAWFPQMVAGPIERAHTLLPQLREINLPSAEQARQGLYWLLWGAFKKLVVAGNVSSFVDHVYAAPASHPPWVVVVATYAFAFQIFCDFSGYTDMAKGSSLLFGVRLTENFNNPYLSRTLPEFWSRWHMSLSSWFFEYVYYPLARAWPTGAGPWLAILAVFALSGIWHGASWTFLAWGLLNGLIYSGWIALRRAGLVPEGAVAGALLVLLNFHLVCLCWIFFRAGNLAVAGAALAQVGSFFVSPGFEGSLPLAGTPGRLASASAGLALMGLNLISRDSLGRASRSSWAGAALAGALVGSLTLCLAAFQSEAFIYFRF